MSSVDSRNFDHHSDKAAVIEAFKSFMAAELPEAEATDDDFDSWVVRYPADGDALPCKLQLYSWTSEGHKADQPTPSTSMRWEIEWDWDLNPTPEELAAAEVRVNDLANRLSAHLERETPTRWVSYDETRTELRGGLMQLAAIATDHFGEPTIFKALVEHGKWTGQLITDDGVEYSAHIEFGQYHATTSDQYFEISAVINGDTLTRLGKDAAQEAIEVAVTELYERLELQLEVSAPEVRHVEFTAVPVQTPAAFFGSGEIINTYLARMGQTDAPWKDGNRVVILAPDDATRIEVSVDLSDGQAGMLEARVTVGVDRVDADFAPEESESWRQIADQMANQIALTVRQEAVAPSFTMRAPCSAVRSLLRQQMNSCFPSDSVNESETSFSIGGFELGDSVYGQLDVALVEVNDLETRITFTGNLWGSGLSDHPLLQARSRSDYRGAIAKVAAQIRDEMVATLAPLPPERPDIGLE